MATDEQVKATRNTQSRARIKGALTELIREKGFDALTVSDLTRRAGVNRGTFYLHFVDKYDLLEQLETEIIGQLEQALLAGDAPAGASCAELFPYEKILSALLIAKSDFAFVAAISGPGGDPEFSSKLKRIIEGLLDSGLARAGTAVKTDAFPEAYARELAISHVLSIIDLWLARGGKEAPEVVARMVVDAKDVCPSQLVG
ncbi:TetR/AcrR family transcriptional regulator [Paratractidigestivibacter sp.]|uniref:TetR/AcrR family transcriptional regulator n=1 Tax=Paratractidigestivibacter sp. TaxID=2847316 RepID=UPI002ACB0947|nr:TetR/AcrR family transcriptional regulator [Paratractidigestivibacter sp.]